MWPRGRRVPPAGAVGFVSPAGGAGSAPAAAQARAAGGTDGIRKPGERDGLRSCNVEALTDGLGTFAAAQQSLRHVVDEDRVQPDGPAANGPEPTAQDRSEERQQVQIAWPVDEPRS